MAKEVVRQPPTSLQTLARCRAMSDQEFWLIKRGDLAEHEAGSQAEAIRADNYEFAPTAGKFNGVRRCTEPGCEPRMVSYETMGLRVRFGCHAYPGTAASPATVSGTASINDQSSDYAALCRALETVWRGVPERS